MDDEHKHDAQPRMSRTETVSHLMRIAQSRRLSREDLDALRMATRAVMKRHFDRQGGRINRRNRREEESSGVYFTPPTAIDAILQSPPFGPPLAEERIGETNKEEE